MPSLVSVGGQLLVEIARVGCPALQRACASHGFGSSAALRCSISCSFIGRSSWTPQAFVANTQHNLYKLSVAHGASVRHVSNQMLTIRNRPAGGVAAIHRHTTSTTITTTITTDKCTVCASKSSSKQPKKGGGKLPKNYRGY